MLILIKVRIFVFLNISILWHIVIMFMLVFLNII